MRIAFTGSSSTGKTTLAREVMRIPEFEVLVGRFLTEDARALLREMGHTSMDEMSREDLRSFQRRYYDQKSENEKRFESFLVDRSFVDVAAYWLVRDAFDLEPKDRDALVLSCEAGARLYDLHFYFPIGSIPFISDGYRSERIDFHERIDAAIRDLCIQWRITLIPIASPNLKQRIEQVVRTAKKASLARLPPT